MRKSMVVALLLAAVALLAVAAPAFAIEGGSGPYSQTASSGEAKLILQEHGLDGGSGIKSDLCEYERCGEKWSALEAATDYADTFWGPPEDGEFCTGPFGNGKTHKETQWACYGVGETFEWQVNVDPWGEETYAHRN